MMNMYSGYQCLTGFDTCPKHCDTTKTLEVIVCFVNILHKSFCTSVLQHTGTSWLEL